MESECHRRVVFATIKQLSAPVQVGFHFLARAFRRCNWDVVFLTIRASGLGDPRLPGPNITRPVVDDGVTSFSWDMPWPATDAQRERAPWRVPSGQPESFHSEMVRSPGQIEDLPADMARLVAGAERFIFDSGSDLLLFDR